MRPDISVGSKFIVGIDSSGYWDILNNNYDSIYFSDTESLDEIFSEYEPGIYEIKIEDVEHYDGERDEYGRWECNPYDIISEVSQKKIGSVNKDWKSESQLRHEHMALLEARMSALTKEIDAHNALLDNDKLALYPSWANTIAFAIKPCDKSWLHKPLATFRNILTDDNVRNIEECVRLYMAEGYIDDKFKEIQNETRD